VRAPGLHDWWTAHLDLLAVRRRRLLARPVLLHDRLGLDLRFRGADVLRDDVPVICAVVAGALASCASLPAGREAAVRAAYEKLGSSGVEAHPASALPTGLDYERIDVSDRMRSASFGHTTTLAVPVARIDGGTPVPNQFWVEYGPSTNSPPRLFGPFPITK
jgi:hypothetical protein